MKDKKAQVSIEFFFALGFILMLFLILVISSYEKSSQVSSSEKYLDEKSLCLKIADGISSAYSGGSGTVVKVKSEYELRVNPQQRIIEISKDVGNLNEFSVTCTLPLSEVAYYNGTIAEFIVPKGTIQMENIDNVIYIESTCVSNIPYEAEDKSTGIIVTNLVRKSDDKKAVIHLSNLATDEDIDLDFLRSNNRRIAYYSVGGDPQTKEEVIDALEEAFQGICTRLSGPQDLEDYLLEPCVILESGTYRNEFLNNINNYNVILWEDPNFDSQEKVTIEIYVNNGGWLIASQKFIKLDQGQKSGNFLDIEFKKSCSVSDGCSKTMSTTLEYEFLRDTNDPELYFIIQDLNSVNPNGETNVKNISAGNYLSIAEDDGFPSADYIARWNYGPKNARVYYFSNFKVTGISPNPVPEAVGGLIRNIVGLYVVGTFESKFKITPLIDAVNYSNTENKISFLLEHEDEPNVLVESVEWKLLFSEDNFVSLCNQTDFSLNTSKVFPNTQTEKLDSCKAPESYLFPFNAEYILLKTKFRANNRDTSLKSNVDYESISICYET